MANVRIADATRNAMMDQITTKIDAGVGGGLIKIYSGTQPATADTALSGNTLLATLTFSATSFGAASNGVITANAITDDTNAAATGTAAFARISDDVPNTVMDVDVGTSGATINLNSTAITAGGTVSITSATLTLPDT